MGDDWSGVHNAVTSERIQAVLSLLTSLEQNDAAYIKGEKERQAWLDDAQEIDNKLAVAGLRLVLRPWRDDSRTNK